jgi:hypothetical protein
MATIINSLEVVLEPPAAPPPAPAPPPPPPHDTWDVVERRARYAARVYAH